MKRMLSMCAVVVVAACGERAPSTPATIALSPDGTRRSGLSYSPDGSRIAWWAPPTDSSPFWQLWVGNPDLTSPRAMSVSGLTLPSAWSPDGTQIALMSRQLGAGSVFVVPSAGGDMRRVTNGAGIQQPVAWHRDGDRMAYVATDKGTFRTMVISTRTGKTAELIPGDARPLIGTWSPDGSHIGYNVYDGSKATIWVADSAGEHAKQLTTEGFEQFSFPLTAWSPDGKELLYESRRTGTADIWVVPIDGAKPRQLTRDVRNDYNASWSSDGKWVAFVSDRGHQIDVWVVSSAGGAEQRITDTETEEYETPRWRPKTNELAFVTTALKSGLWALDVADGKERRLAPDSLRISFFDVSPDGRQVDFVVERGGGIQELMVMPLAGGEMRTLISGAGTVSEPYWSPDGSKIVFTSDRGGTWDAWVVDAAGGAPRQLMAWPGYESFARWSGDGSTIYFTSDRDAKLGDVWKVSPSGGEPTRVTRNGSVGALITRRGVADIFIGTINPSGGQLGISRVRPDGTLQAVWDRTNAFSVKVSPRGDSIIASIEQPDGKMVGTILSANGGPGRIILKANEASADWSNDGKFLAYTVSVNGTNDLGILSIADGTKRRLTTTPDNEAGAQFTPDGKTVVFRRAQTVQRAYKVDLSKLLTKKIGN